MADIEEQFDAAVTVIKGLPTGGPYQPSHAVMLKFYGYYKQATQGRCNQPKPSFWDVVGKAKWDAWNKCGDMSQRYAMTLYIAELKQIIETMSFTSEVSSFIDTLGPFYESVLEDEDNQTSRILEYQTSSDRTMLPLDHIDGPNAEKKESSLEKSRKEGDSELQNSELVEFRNIDRHIDKSVDETSEYNQLDQDDAFIREGMAFTSSLLSARKELDQIKEYTEGPNNLSDSIEIPNFPLSNELDSDFIISQDAINHSSFSPTQISDYNILPLENKLSDRFSISSDTESDVYEVPMSSPDIPIETPKSNLNDSPYPMTHQSLSMSVKCDENTEVVTDLSQVSSMRRALLHTEKGLKDAVAMLRNDMIDIVTRIDKIEQKLNQVALKCCNCRCRANEEENRLLLKDNIHHQAMVDAKQMDKGKEHYNTNVHFHELSRKTLIMILAWPFIANAICAGVKTTARHLTRRN